MAEFTETTAYVHHHTCATSVHAAFVECWQLLMPAPGGYAKSVRNCVPDVLPADLLNANSQQNLRLPKSEEGKKNLSCVAQQL